MRSMPGRMGDSGFFTTEPLRRTLPSRMRLKAWEREQKPSLERARARPTRFSGAAFSENGFLFEGRTEVFGQFTLNRLRKAQEAGRKASATWKNEENPRAQAGVPVPRWPG